MLRRAAGEKSSYGRWWPWDPGCHGRAELAELDSNSGLADFRFCEVPLQRLACVRP